MPFQAVSQLFWTARTCSIFIWHEHRVRESPSHACITPFPYGFQCWHDVQLAIYNDDTVMVLLSPSRVWAVSLCLQQVEDELSSPVVLFKFCQDMSAGKGNSVEIIWTYLKSQTCMSVKRLQTQIRLGYLNERWNLFSVVASSRGSVEGYCAGEKEVLDAFNRWVSHLCPALLVRVRLCVCYKYNCEACDIAVHFNKMLKQRE